MAKARDIPGSTPRCPFAEAAARDGRGPRARSSSSTPTASSTRDIERVHDMRVATPPPARGARDLRAVLPARRAQARVLRDVKALADALGARRDPDVQLAALDGNRARSGSTPPTARASRPSPTRCAPTQAPRQRGARPRPCARGRGEDDLERTAAGARRAGRAVREGRPRREGPQGQGPRPRRAARRQRRAHRRRAPRRAASLHPGGARPRRGRRRCTTCGSPPSACATSSR